MEYSKGVQKYIEKAKKELEERKKYLKELKKKKFDTLAVHGLYSMEEAFEGGKGGIIEPIFPSTSQAYRDSDEMEAGLAYLIPTWCYSRIVNPTVTYLEETLSLLETYGTPYFASALCTSAGMAAIKQAVEPFLDLNIPYKKGVNFVSTAQCYGGTFQLFNLRMNERGAKVRWVQKPWEIGEWEKHIDEDTRFLYGEMPSNPQQACFDIEKVAELAHSYNIPLIVDATVGTPALLRPMAYGADIVIHSITKTVGSGGFSIGGAIVSKENIISKHLPEEIKQDYALWLKLWPFRDSGPCMSPYSAFLFLNELRTLRIKVKHYSQSTMKVAEFLKSHPKVERVDYLGLKDHFLHPIAKKYMKLADEDLNLYGHLMSFNIKGSAEDTRKVFDSFKMIWRATDLGRVKSVATIPAISTHQQQGEEGRKLAGIPPTMIRLSVGGEAPEDIISDLEKALSKI
ncbi:MAG: aminotransferase class V-fold PLP-dependent enzyme [Thermoanaerobaculia bacterium]